MTWKAKEKGTVKYDWKTSKDMFELYRQIFLASQKGLLNKSVSLKELSQKLKKKKNTLSEQAKALEKAGLVVSETVNKEKKLKTNNDLLKATTKYSDNIQRLANIISEFNIAFSFEDVLTIAQNKEYNFDELKHKSDIVALFVKYLANQEKELVETNKKMADLLRQKRKIQSNIETAKKVLASNKKI